MTKVVNVIGARPQFIKYFPVAEAFKEAARVGAAVTDILVHTGQHYDYGMSKIFFDELGIREPEYHLGVGSCLHGDQTGQILRKVEEVCLKERPDAVLVYGDTNSTLGAALAASKLHLPVAHVEAGLRSFNKLMPEEINRILTDHVSTLLLCPSKTAVKNLRDEGFRNVLNGGETVDGGFKGVFAEINNPCVINVGDVMYDVLIHASALAEKRSSILSVLGLEPGGYRMLTVHRAESTDDPAAFEEIIGFVNEASSGKTVIFPMHPRTKKSYEGSRKRFSANVRIIEPLGYFDVLKLLKNSALLMSDSGGMQKEAYWLKVPCITLRDRTEWVETVESGWNVLFRDYRGGHSPGGDADPYGDGKAAQRIVGAVIGIKK